MDQTVTRYDTFDELLALLRAVGGAGRRTGAARVRRRRRASGSRCRTQVCAGPAGDRAHPGRRRGLRARARVPAARGPGQVRLRRGRPGDAGVHSREARADRVRGAAREGAAGGGRAAGQDAAAPPPRRDRRVRRGRSRDARRDRGRRIRRVAHHAPPDPRRLRAARSRERWSDDDDPRARDRARLPRAASRSPARRPPTSSTASGCCRGPSGRR